MLQTFSIYENGHLKGTVEATSLLCAKTYAHVALNLVDGKNFIYNHDALHHTLVEEVNCTPYSTISNEESLYQFLYNQTYCSHGTLTTDISIGIDFYKSHTDSYPTISYEKILDGNHRTIKPSSTFTHGASNEMYLFKTDKSLTLHNLTVSGFIYGPRLTIIDSTGPYLGLSGCTFRNNKVYQHIFVEASNNVTDICNSLFQDVRSSRFGPSGGGGVIISMGQTLSIYDSSFIRNSSLYYDGGAIKHGNMSGSTGGILTLSGHNYFRDNSSVDGFGGAIASWSKFQPYAVQLYGTAEFSGNSSPKGGGGALFIRTGISLSTGPYEFTGNQADSGGAISSNHITISGGSGSTFTKNSASYGGALFAVSGGIILDGSFSFIENSGSFGGALFTDASGITLRTGPYEFSGNKANLSGGAIYSKNEITISGGSGSTFTKNYAGKGPGGALFAVYGGIILDGSFSFIENSGSFGGALFTDASGITLRTGPYEFSGNKATVGGALYANGTITLDGSSSFISNRSTDQSGQHIYTRDICYNGSDVSFIDPSCITDGSAVWVTSSGKCKCP